MTAQLISLVSEKRHDEAISPFKFIERVRKDYIVWKADQEPKVIQKKHHWYRNSARRVRRKSKYFSSKA